MKLWRRKREIKKKKKNCNESAFYVLRHLSVKFLEDVSSDFAVQVLLDFFNGVNIEHYSSFLVWQDRLMKLLVT